MTSENPSGGDAGNGPRTPQDWLHALGEAAAFFTCLPFGGDRTPRFRGADILPTWPVVGLAIGLAAGIDLTITSWFGGGPWLAAGVALLTGIVLTGALHEDGLSDTVDAFGAPTDDRLRRLEILRDSRIGTYGAIAIGLSLLLRAAALAQVTAAAGTGAALLTLSAVHSLSRAAMAWPLAGSSPARSDGLGAGMGAPAMNTAILTLLIGSGAAFVCLIGVASLAALLAPPLAAALAAGSSTVARERIGGYTGDTLGATQQVVEIALLVLVALCVGDA